MVKCQEKYCAGCGASNKGSAKFCGRCGTPFTRTLVPEPRPPPGAVVLRPADTAKSPLVMGLLSFFIPGLGQVILGEVKRGAIFFAVAVCAVLGVATVFVSLVAAVWSAVDAYKLAKVVVGRVEISA